MAPHCMTAHWESATLKILSYTHKTGSRNTPKEPVPGAGEGDRQGGPASQSVLCRIRIISLLSNMNPQRESTPTVPCPFHTQKAPYHWRDGTQTSPLKETLPRQSDSACVYLPTLCHHLFLCGMLLHNLPSFVKMVHKFLHLPSTSSFLWHLHKNS